MAVEVQRVIEAWSESVELVTHDVSADRRRRIVAMVSSVSRHRSEYFLREQRHARSQTWLRSSPPMPRATARCRDHGEWRQVHQLAWISTEPN
jgi:hypothetical protein